MLQKKFPPPGKSTQREDITRGLSTLFAVNHTQRKRYQTHVVDPTLTPLPFQNRTSVGGRKSRGTDLEQILPTNA